MGAGQEGSSLRYTLLVYSSVLNMGWASLKTYIPCKFKTQPEKKSKLCSHMEEQYSILIKLYFRDEKKTNGFVSLRLKLLKVFYSVSLK